MPLISQKRLEKEAFIIDAAEAVFFSKGFANAKMENVAEKAGMSKGSVYFYFKSKDDLYMAITYRAFLLLIDMYRKVLDNHKHKDGRSRVIEILNAYIGFSEKHFHYHEALFNYMSLIRNINKSGSEKQGRHIGVGDGLYFDKIKDVHNLPVDIVVHEIAMGKKDGSITNEHKAEMIYLTAWALVSGYIKLSIYGGKGRESIHHVSLADWKTYIIEVAAKILDGT